MAGDCLFCKIIRGEIPSQKVYEDEHSIAFKDINPVAPTHVLIVSKRHLPSLSATSSEDKELLGHLQGVVREVAKKGQLESFRVVVNNGRAAGQTVDHLHYHLLSGRRMTWPPG